MQAPATAVPLHHQHRPSYKTMMRAAVRAAPTTRVSHSRRNGSATHRMQYKPDRHTDAGAVSTTAQLLTADEIMADMCTMLGGAPTPECFTGYAGQWRTWELIPHHTAAAAAADTASSAPQDSPDPVDGDTNAPVAQCSSSSGQYGIKLIDDSINVRLWRLQQQQQQPHSAAEQVSTGPSENEGSGSVSIQQANFYHHPVKMAGPSTRFAPYLTGNTMSGRPDGYGLRLWSFTRDSDMLQPDASGWLGSKAEGGTTSSTTTSTTTTSPSRECSMRVLTVPHVATTIINGALPSGFEEGHNPRFWVLEFIVKERHTAERRWASMNWYDLGQLVVNRSINEDMVQLQGEPDDISIDPQAINFSSRRDGLLPLDIDAWATHHTAWQQGTATVFSYSAGSASEAHRASDGAQTTAATTAATTDATTDATTTTADNTLHLSRTSHLPCSWTNPFEATAVAASSAGGGSTTAAASAGGGKSAVDVVVQVYPDWSYCRVPRDIRSVVESGLHDVAVFEAGSVLRDGTLVRWVLQYETSGKRLIKSATLETYPPAEA